MKKIFILILILPFLAKSQGTKVDSAGNVLSTYLSIGTSKTSSPLTVTNFTTSFIAPQTGTIIHIVSDNTVNGRISSDTYNNTSFTGRVNEMKMGASYEDFISMCYLIVSNNEKKNKINNLKAV